MVRGLTTGAIMTPLFLTSTYVQDGVAQPRQGHEYARVTNPTRTALEQNLASLEGGEHGLAFASGLAAIEAVLKANGLERKDVVKCLVMLADIDEWGRFNEVYAEFFQAPYPARSAFAATGLALGARVELECIAVYPD